MAMCRQITALYFGEKASTKAAKKRSDRGTDVIAEALLQSLDETLLKDGRRDTW